MTHRKLPILAVVVAVLLAGTSSSVLADDLPRRNQMFRILNQTRRTYGRPVLRLNATVSHRAWLHSRNMVQQNTLFHTRRLYAAVRAYRPSAWGENVGMAGVVTRVRTLWMRSGGHRAILLDRRYRRVGVGIVQARGGVWVTAIFYGG